MDPVALFERCTIAGVDSREHMESRLHTLWSVLACPVCAGPLTAAAGAIEVGGVVADATLLCAEHGAVGVMRDFRASFHPEDLGGQWLPPGVVETLIPFADLDAVGSWTQVPEGALGDGEGTRVTGRLGECGTVIEFLRHSWSGTITFESKGFSSTVDLRSDDMGSETIRLGPADESGGTWTATLRASLSDPERNQMVLTRVRHLDPVDGHFPVFEPLNAGNPYPPRFEELLRAQPADAVVVDVGGGDRRHVDPRVLNFEYLKFDRSDFFGNGLQLPIRTNSVDLVLSQAVLEHVPDPQLAVREILRILKPGGTVYCEIAFMQPLHAVPFHYFNVTPHGLDLLFSEYDVVAKGTAGGLEDTMRWIFRLVGADDVLGHAESGRVLGALAVVDSTMPADVLDSIASFVWIEALKPPVEA